MNGWIIFALYVIVWLISGAWLSRRILIGMERAKLAEYDTPSRRRLYSPDQIRRETRIDPDDRAMAVVGGVGLSLLMPGLAALVVAVYDLVVTRTRIFHTPNEVARNRADRDAAELAEYRRLAAEFDLPTPKLPQ
jgi:hypothetical protein